MLEAGWQPILDTGELCLRRPARARTVPPLIDSVVVLGTQAFMESRVRNTGSRTRASLASLILLACSGGGDARGDAALVVCADNTCE